MSDAEWTDADAGSVIDIDGGSEASPEAGSPDPEGAQAPEGSEGASEEGWTKAKAVDETHKRQEIERENRELRERLARLEGMVQGRTPKEESREPDWESLIDYGDLGNSIPRAVKTLVDHALKGEMTKREKTRMERFAARVARSRETAMDRYDDFVEVLESAGYDNQVARDPQLYAAVFEAPDPAEYAYRWAKRKMSGGSEVQKLKARIAELEAKAEGRPPPKQRTSLAATGGRGPKPGKTTYDPNSVLDDALDGR
jgi:hypothetical protein